MSELTANEVIKIPMIFQLPPPPQPPQAPKEPDPGQPGLAPPAPAPAPMRPPPPYNPQGAPMQTYPQNYSRYET